MEKGVDFHPGGDIHPLCLYGLGQPVLGDRLHITLADVVAARKATCQAACPGQPVEGIAPSDHQMHTFYI